MTTLTETISREPFHSINPREVTYAAQALTGVAPPLLVEYVQEPTSKDVLLGRGKTAFTHQGNSKFRELIVSKMGFYLGAKRRRDKRAVTDHIISTVWGYGGRFLRKQDNRSFYIVCRDLKSLRDKVGHAVRDISAGKIKGLGGPGPGGGTKSKTGSNKNNNNNKSNNSYSDSCSSVGSSPEETMRRDDPQGSVSPLLLGKKESEQEQQDKRRSNNNEQHKKRPATSPSPTNKTKNRAQPKTHIQSKQQGLDLLQQQYELQQQIIQRQQQQIGDLLLSRHNNNNNNILQEQQVIGNHLSSSSPSCCPTTMMLPMQQQLDKAALLYEILNNNNTKNQLNFDNTTTRTQRLDRSVFPPSSTRCRSNNNNNNQEASSMQDGETASHCSEVLDVFNEMSLRDMIHPSSGETADTPSLFHSQQNSAFLSQQESLRAGETTRTTIRTDAAPCVTDGNPNIFIVNDLVRQAMQMMHEK